MSWWKKLTGKARRAFGTKESSSPPPEGCNHDSIQLRQGTAEFEGIFIARGELEGGNNLPHGASHLANLLSYDPARSEWIELLEGYLAAAQPNPESLIPRGDKLYFSSEAMRTYIWQKQGRLQEAIDLLINVMQAKRDAGYLDAWALAWLEQPQALESLPQQLGLQVFAFALTTFPEARQSTVARLRIARRWSALIDRAAKTYNSDGMLRMVRAGMLRKSGQYDEALGVVCAAGSAPPDWHTATAMGLILRQQGKLEAAEQAFQAALQFDPSDVSARLEAADTFFENERWSDALRWYDGALTKDRNQVWAKPSAIYCRWKIDNQERHLNELVALAKQGNDRANYLCHLAFTSGLPEPVDATANVLRQIRDMLLKSPSEAPKGSVNWTISGLEAPSNFLAFRTEMASLNSDVQMEVTIEKIPTPDPRWPIEPVKYLLWDYEGTNSSPALSAPAADVADEIGRLASAPFERETNWAAASAVAERLGAVRVKDTLATMVHPPPMPAGVGALAWIPRVQLAAAQVVAQLDDGWEDSVRREALLSVLWGPMDWATEAAIRALAQLGRSYEPIAPDIHEAFQKLADHQPRGGYCCWEHTLYQCWLELPHLWDNERESLQNKLRAIEAAGQN